MNQELFQILVGCVSFLAGIVIKKIMDDLRSLVIKLQAIEVLVAGEYVKKDDFEAKVDAMFIKLDQIFDRLDSKADKATCKFHNGGGN